MLVGEVVRRKGSAWAYEVVIHRRAEANRVPIGEIMAGEGLSTCHIDMMLVLPLRSMP